MGFSKKILSFLKTAEGNKFAVRCVSYGNISLKCLFRPHYEVFWQKIRKLWTLEKLENMMQKKCFFFEEKTFSSFKIASLPNWEGAKYADGSRTSCFIFYSSNFKKLKTKSVACWFFSCFVYFKWTSYKDNDRLVFQISTSAFALISFFLCS